MLRLLTLAVSVLLLAVASREWDAVPCADTEAPVPVEPTPREPETPDTTLAQEEPVSMPELPAAEQVAALSAETRLAQATALKTLLLGQDMRLVRENHRLTPENLRESADAAQVAGAPLFWRQAMLAMAGDTLSSRERHELENRLRDFYVLYGVDWLAVRLFVETSDLSQEEIAQLLPRLPIEHLFNLPPRTPATAEQLETQAGILKEVFSAIKTQFESVHDKESADAAANALVPFLPLFDSTHQLRLSGAQDQVRAFTEYREFFPPAAKAIHDQRLRLVNAGFFDSPWLRALNYLLQ